MSLIHLIRFGQSDHDLLHGRDEEGRLIQQCSLCGFSRLVLAEAAITGPAHRQVLDMGARTMKAQIVKARPENVREMRRGER